MPDNHVYVVYSGPREIPLGSIRNELFVAMLEEFSFEYEEGVLFKHYTNLKKPLYLNSFVDEYNPKLKIVKKMKISKKIFNSDHLVESLLNTLIKPVPQ